MIKLYHDKIEHIHCDLPTGHSMALLDLPFGTTKNHWDTPIDLDFMWEVLNRVLNTNSAVVCFAQQPFTTHLINSNIKGYKHRWIWDKKQSGNFAVAKYQPLSVIEDIIVFTLNGERCNYYPQMRKGKMRWRGSKNSEKHGQGFGDIEQVYYQSDEYYPTNILEFSAVPRRNSLHSAQKPVGLLEYLIKTYTLENETVIDLTMGVGSTGVACQNLNRGFTGIEKEKQFYDISEQRINTRS